MFNFSRDEQALLMAASDNYKIIEDKGWLYVFPASADFKSLAGNPGMAVWDQLAVIRIDDHGNVRGNRFGKISREYNQW